jgi:hypothetical protein
MAFSVDITAAAEVVEANDKTRSLGRVLSAMIMGADCNAFGSMTEANQKLAQGCEPCHIPEYEYLFAATLEGLSGADYTDEPHLAELADTWIEAYLYSCHIGINAID